MFLKGFLRFSRTRSGVLSELGCDIITLFVIHLIWALIRAESLRLEAMRELLKTQADMGGKHYTNLAFFAVQFFSVDLILAITLIFVSLVCMVNQEHLHSTLS